MSKLGGVTNTGTVVSNLPLLFADGYPTSLEVITVKQLERFITFMMNCSAGRTASCKDSMPMPKWWPPEVDFAFPFVKTPELEPRWISVLKLLVLRCYGYHDCKFMLTFCTDLAQFPLPLLKFVDLQDGTTALRNKETGKLLVTFRNENRAYDRKADSPRKYLLHRCPRPTHQQLIDIYLCDSCDAEFETLAQAQEHERVCQPEQAAAAVQSLRSATPDDSMLDVDQSRFLSFFELRSCESDDPSTPASKCSPVRKRPLRFKRGFQRNVNLTRVPFSSPLGLALQQKVNRGAPYQVTQAHMDRVERYCLPAKGNARGAYSYRSGPKRGVRGWVHIYCFNRRDKRERALTIETGLNQRSRELLRRCCGVSVRLPRLTEEEIAEHTAPKLPVLSPSPVRSPRHIPVIDLCSSDDENCTAVKPVADSPRSTVPSRLHAAGRGVPVSHLLLPVSAHDRLSPFIHHQLLADTTPHLFPLTESTQTSGKPIPPCETVTRRRWPGKIPKITLASENGIVSDNVKRRKLDRSRLRGWSGYPDSNSTLQALNTIEENAPPTKEWSFITSNRETSQMYATSV